MWSNPPPEVTSLRTMLVASTTWATLAGSAATTSIHYPSLPIGDSATPAVVPSLLIEPNNDGTDVMSPGVVLPDGTITVIFRHLVDGPGTIETTARAIAYEVSKQMVGLPITSHKVGMASKPKAPKRAAQKTSDGQSAGLTNAATDIAIVFSYRIG